MVWNWRSAAKVSVGVLAAIGCYIVAVTMSFPNRFYYHETHFSGISGWTWGGLMIAGFLVTTLAFLVPSKTNFAFKGNVESYNSPYKIRHAAATYTMVLVAMFVIMFATQVIQFAVSLKGGDPDDPDKIYGLFDDPDRAPFIKFIVDLLAVNRDIDDTANLIWNFSAVFLVLGFVLLIVSVVYTRRASFGVQTGWNVWVYAALVNFAWASTGMMWSAWMFVVDPADPSMMWKVEEGQDFGYFALGKWGVFFSSVPELMWLWWSSQTLSFAGYFVVNMKLRKSTYIPEMVDVD